MAHTSANDGRTVSRLLKRIDAGLPLLADLSRADMLVYTPGATPGTVVVRTHIQPCPVSTVYTESIEGQVSDKKTAASVFQVMQRGRQIQAFTDRPSIQEIFPLRTQEGSIVGALVVESAALEYDRMKKKSPVFQAALRRIREAVMSGRIQDADRLGRLGDHDGMLVIDSQGFIKYISGIAENLYRRHGHVGSLLSIHVDDLQTDESIISSAFSENCCLEREVRDGEFIWIKKAVPIEADPGPWFPGRGERPPQPPGSVMLIVRDVTEDRKREQALTVKNAMIKEIHHRVKNNLQTVAALMRMQARRSTNPEVSELLAGSINRILSVAVVHEFLSLDEDSIINLREVCTRIVSEVTRGILDPDKNIRVILEAGDVNMPAQQATSAALIVNELLQNAVKHGFDGRQDGNVVLRLAHSDSSLIIEIEDDGNGIQIKDNTDHTDTGGHLGLQIVKTLVTEDLRGTFALESHQGVTARIVLPRLVSQSNGTARS